MTAAPARVSSADTKPILYERPCQSEINEASGKYLNVFMSIVPREAQF